MTFDFKADQFGEKLPDDPDFPARPTETVEKVYAQANVQLVVDPDAELDEGAEGDEQTLYYVDLQCTDGNRFSFAEFYK